ncbi:uncharacterized protein Pyn_20449 [Prunus yedoensis var. nudiflora]|uniref:Nudix hydrolase domain-containing protein n=2 Tax=Prunus yedoensis var. nudiflora TaxID=2094558 RepID=A0A314XQ07_PRUYE|nr:uncharacterized protein Pyn_20449 [Prunus yedoensis var. nudiflora]
MPPPPQPPIRNNHTNLLQNPNNNLPTLPDLLLTALSFCFLFSSSTTRANRFSKTPFLHFPSSPRRFLKIPIMSLHHFATPQSLSDWLRPRLLSDSLASWGVKPGTKNVHNLWLELSEGESSLADSTPPVRTVHVVTVRIIDDKFRVLVEAHQELSDGSVRSRGRPLSEKMKPGEDPESAANRAVMEELGSILNGSVKDSGNIGILKIVPGSYEKKVEERHSASYPGLPACYVLHSVDAWVDGLPEGEFCTEEEHEYANCGEMSIAHEAVSVKKHFWKWVSLNSVRS